MHGQICWFILSLKISPSTKMTLQTLLEPKLKTYMYSKVENSKPRYFQLKSLKKTQLWGLGMSFYEQGKTWFQT